MIRLSKYTSELFFSLRVEKGLHEPTYCRYSPIRLGLKLSNWAPEKAIKVLGFR